MFAEQIEKIKRDYTDKYVLVDASRPELARFRDVVGRVKTVNMNGRALVEFDDYHVNIGWYDIAPEYLRVVDKPPPKPPKPEGKKASPKAAPAAKKPAGEVASAAGKSPAPKTGKPSVADILAAARAGKSAGGAPAAMKPAESVKAPTSPPSAKVDKSKMSVADMIAAARAGGAVGAVAPAAKAPTAKQQAEPEPQVEPKSEASPAAEAPAPAAKSTERIDKSKMTIAEMVAWCREHDTK